MVNAVVDCAAQDRPADGRAFRLRRLAFGGLIFGSLLGNCFLPRRAVADELVEARGGQN